MSFLTSLACPIRWYPRHPPKKHRTTIPMKMMTMMTTLQLRRGIATSSASLTDHHSMPTTSTVLDLPAKNHIYKYIKTIQTCRPEEKRFENEPFPYLAVLGVDHGLLSRILIGRISDERSGSLMLMASCPQCVLVTGYHGSFYM